MPSRQRVFVRPRVLTVVGFSIALSTLFTFRGSCSPVGSYTDPSGFHYFIVQWRAIGAVYGNGCKAYISTFPLVVGLTMVIGSTLLKMTSNR